MYKKEELRFFNMDTRTTLNGKSKIYALEDELSETEKIAFIDEMKNGFASYMLGILNKWEEEKESLPKDSYGDTKTVSKKAWIKRNDNRKVIGIDWKVGSYWFLGTFYKMMSLTCPNTEHGYRYLYTDSPIVKQWFHDLCSELYIEEKKYFESINPFDIKLEKVKAFAKKHSVYFDNELLQNVVWNDRKNISEEELDVYIEMYEELEKYIAGATEITKKKIAALKQAEENLLV